MKIKFYDSKEIYEIKGFCIIENKLVIIEGTGLPENTSGFQILHDAGSVNDYSEFTVKYNILTPIEGVLMLSNSEDNVETKDNPANSYFYQLSEDELKNMLEQIKQEKIGQSKTPLAEYLAGHPLISKVHGGKEGTYSVTQEKQSLMMSQYMTYQVEKAVNPDAKLTWNETGEECEEWKEEEFLQLILEVKQYVYPLVSYQQRIEKEINACTTDEELAAVVIDYSLFVNNI